MEYDSKHHHSRAEYGYQQRSTQLRYKKNAKKMPSCFLIMKSN